MAAAPLPSAAQGAATTLAAWQAENQAALLARLAPIRKLRNGTIYTEPVGIHFHVITKQGPELRFWLVEQNNPSTGVIQSEINLDKPLELVEAYTLGMMLSLLWQPQPTRIYLPGLGGGRLVTTFHHTCPAATIFATEIEPGVVEVAKHFFGLPQDERVQVAIADGRVWLDQTDQQFDLIGVDVFLDNGYSPYRLNTVEFYQLCRTRLRPGGVVAANFLADDPYLARRLQSMAAAFPHVWYFRLPVGESPHDNLVAFAADHPMLDAETLRARAEQLTATHQFTFPFVQLIGSLYPYVAGPDARSLLDDDPPANYFDDLPAFNTAFSQVQPDLPCPCGSGKRFASCHGRA